MSLNIDSFSVAPNTINSNSEVDLNSITDNSLDSPIRGNIIYEVSDSDVGLYFEIDGNLQNYFESIKNTMSFIPNANHVNEEAKLNTDNVSTSSVVRIKMKIRNPDNNRVLDSKTFSIYVSV